MSKKLFLTLEDQLFDNVSKKAANMGLSPQEYIISAVSKEMNIPFSLNSKKQLFDAICNELTRRGIRYINSGYQRNMTPSADELPMTYISLKSSRPEVMKNMWIEADLLARHIVVKFEYKTTSEKKRGKYINIFNNQIQNRANNKFKVLSHLSNFLIEDRDPVDYNNVNSNFYMHICNELEFLKNTLNF